MKVLALKSRKGFSLIEILTVVGAIAVLGAATFGVVLGVNDAVKSAKSKDTAQQIQAVVAQYCAAKGIAQSALSSADLTAIVNGTGVTATIGTDTITFKLQTAPTVGTYTYVPATGTVTSVAAGTGAISGATGT
jgi:prepilin-type N-terminal cleavage/methylation domain-containing protein